MIVHQFHHSVSPADAISNQMLWIQSELAKAGIGGEVFAVDRKDGIEDRVRPFESNGAERGDLLLIHHSEGNPELQSLFNLGIPKALIYHNITPPQFFRHDPVIAEQCHFGRLQLSWFVPNVVAAFADSEYNADELMHHGHVSVQLLPLFPLDLDPDFHKPRERGDGPFRILFVGRLSPHKNQAHLIHAAAYLRQMKHDDFRLTLVGSGDRVYKKYLEGLIKAYHLDEHVLLTGKVSEEALQGHYHEADLFVCVSLHEGFCIPIIEAMRANTPVLAAPKTAVVETMSGGGMALHSDSTSDLARVISILSKHPDWLDEIRVSQHRRLHDLAQFQNGKVLVDKITSVLQQIPATSST